DQMVTLGATPEEGNNFDGWYEGDTKLSSLPNYTFKVQGDMTLAGKFVTMPQSCLKVTIEGEGSVEIDGATIVPGEIYEYAIDTLIKLTAAPEDGYEFAYWEDIALGSMISTNSTYECEMGAGVNVKAVFKSIPTDTTHFTVTFMDIAGKVIKTEKVEPGSHATPPGTPVLPGYLFKSWDQAYSEVTEDLTIRAIYQREDAKYTLTVENGTILYNDMVVGAEAQFQFDVPVTVKANPPGEGKKFSHWIQDGVKISTKSSYGFFTPMKNTTLRADYVDENDQVVNVPFITLNPLKDTGDAIAYTVHRDVPDAYTLVQSGIILKTGDVTGKLTINTQDAVIGRIKNSSTDQFYIYKNKKGETWQARAYLIYQDEAGNIVTAYSD
ncbi:MAG: InlB B-repeat-containing protein, partial [Desulfotomaculaceae bacterium]|nr:InlB B-repeat-containing protein [Desulfotomaculaceae bacterium]